MTHSPLASIRLLCMDVDGVLTDGRLFYGPEGEALKVFNVRDGAAIRLLQRADLRLAVISGRDGPALRRRLQELDLEPALLHLGCADKDQALSAVLAHTGISARETAHVGDDLPDLPVLRRVGQAIGVADGHPSVRAVCHRVTDAVGGAGVIAEIAEALLRARGDWQRLTGLDDAPAGDDSS